VLLSYCNEYSSHHQLCKSLIFVDYGLHRPIKELHSKKALRFSATVSQSFFQFVFVAYEPLVGEMLGLGGTSFYAGTAFDADPRQPGNIIEVD